MSRTYRTHLEWKTRAQGCDWTWEEQKAYLDEIGMSPWESLGWNGHYYVDRKCRDKKAWDKPDKSFKSMKRRIERSNMNAAVREGKDIPVFRNSDQWDWT